MKVRLPILIQDQMVTERKGMSQLVEQISLDEDIFLSGPVSKPVAVLDFDPDSGELCDGVPLLMPDEPDGEVLYLDVGDSPSRDQITDPKFIALNTFATVHRTMGMFEEADTLGRRLSWAFDAPQLLVVPRAGEWANAYYERDSHSLQFFHFPSQRKEHEEEIVYTGLSHDIVAHETAHAVLDGIAPDLYHAITPQSLALHEAVADLTAVIMAFRSDPLRKAVLDDTGGSIERSTAFSSIAEEFGALRKAQGPRRPLRLLLNKKKMPQTQSERTSPHELSEVLTGALYSVMVRMHKNRKKQYAEQDGTSLFSASGKALFVAGEHFKRMIFRALDYLPPGEVSFADYGRAILAADEASHPEWKRERNWVRDEFVRRGIADKGSALESHLGSQKEISKLNEALSQIDLRTLVESDWAAYEFANDYRDLLRVPKDKPDLPLWVRPRLDVTKQYRAPGGGTKDVRECIFKVSWEQEEDNPSTHRLPPRRQVTVGTTLAIDWDRRKVRARLTSDQGAAQRRDRSEMVVRLAKEGRLRVGQESTGPDGQLLRSYVTGHVAGDSLRIKNSARMLHIAAQER